MGSYLLPAAHFLLLVVQVNPHTHQLKICDFGSAKMLVRIDVLIWMGYLSDEVY